MKKITAKNPVNFIAMSVSMSFVGSGETAQEAVENLQSNALDYDGDPLPVNNILVYQVVRHGKAVITVEWVSE